MNYALPQVAVPIPTTAAGSAYTPNPVELKINSSPRMDTAWNIRNIYSPLAMQLVFPAATPGITGSVLEVNTSILNSLGELAFAQEIGFTPLRFGFSIFGTDVYNASALFSSDLTNSPIIFNNSGSLYFGIDGINTLSAAISSGSVVFNGFFQGASSSVFQGKGTMNYVLKQKGKEVPA